MLEWIILGALVGGTAAVVSHFWEEIKDWIAVISYKIKRTSKMFIKRLTQNTHEITIEGTTKIVREEDVPVEIRNKSKYSSKSDITNEARQVGILEY